MLFDLRGRGRRRTIQAIYLALAILMGGGLVLFGIGGNTSGGLFDAFTGGGGGGGGGQFEKLERRYEKAVAANARNERAWAQLARTRYQVAGQGENYDQSTQQFTSKGRAKLAQAAQAWDRYLALEPAKVDANLAVLMVQALVALNKLDQAVRAQEIVVEARPRSANLFARLAVLAYQAGQTRKGDLAAKEAVRLTPKDLRQNVRDQLDQAKVQGGLGGRSAAP